jgi:hypothetical protein
MSTSFLNSPLIEVASSTDVIELSVFDKESKRLASNFMWSYYSNGGAVFQNNSAIFMDLPKLRPDKMTFKLLKRGWGLLGVNIELFISPDDLTALAYLVKKQWICKALVPSHSRCRMGGFRYTFSSECWICGRDTAKLYYDFEKEFSAFPFLMEHSKHFLLDGGLDKSDSKFICDRQVFTLPQINELSIGMFLFSISKTECRIFDKVHFRYELYLLKIHFDWLESM